MPKFQVKIAHATNEKSGKSTREYTIEANSKSAAESEALSKCRKDNPNNTVFEVRSAKEV
jgi:hypothetical protein